MRPFSFMVTILSFAEITSVDTIAGLLMLYNTKGFSFSEHGAFIEAITTDWQQERRRISNETASRIQSNPSDSIPSLLVESGGQEYEVYGVIHIRNAGDRYHTLVRQSTGDKKNCLLEQGLSELFPYIPNAIETNDHSLETKVSSFRRGFFDGLRAPLSRFKTNKNKPNSQEAERGKQEQVFLAHALSPLETWYYPLPHYVNIETRIDRHQKLTIVQRRSAYLAEFTRAWNVPGTKRILTGARHSSEIGYFLKYPIREQEIVEKAQEHVDLLHRDQDAFTAMVNKDSHARSQLFRQGYKVAGIVYPLSVGILGAELYHYLVQ